MDSIGKQIWKQRKLSGITQDVLSKSLGLKSNQVRHWEAGRSQPQAKYLILMKKKYGWKFKIE